MAKVPPFNSSLQQHRNVYHDDNQCTEGNNIQKRRSAYTGNPTSAAAANARKPSAGPP